MAGLHFDITGDNTNLMEKLKEVERGVKSASASVEKEGGSIEQFFSRMSKTAAAFGAGFTAKELIQNIVQVRGEFQQLEVAFTTMLGSEDKAVSLLSQLTRTAATTPFDLQGVANGARQLLAYGTAAEDVNETLVRLGNIAAGLSIPLNDLVYLYGTTMTQGRLYTQDLNQFTGRGIPMIRELAKEFNVAETEIKSMVEAGKVGFPEVQKVIQNLTNEGGMFYNLMEEQSKTITGQISNIEDAFSMMLNNIGKSSEGIINEALSGVSYLIENYETVGRALLEITAAYGAYKAALITITALQKAHSVVLAQAVVEQNLAAAAGITLSNAQAMAAARIKLLTVAQSALNKTLLANPYVAAAAAVTALGLGVYKLVTYQSDAEKAQEKLNEALKESERASLSEQRELAKLKGELSALKKGTEEYNTVKEKIINGYSKYYNGLEEEINKVGLTEEAYKKLTKAITQSFGARQYQQFKSQQESNLDSVMSENLGKIQERLIDKLGEEAGSRYYVKIRDAIMQGSLKAINGTSNIKGLDKETMSALDKVAGAEGGLFDIANRSVEGYIANILNAMTLADELDKKARQRFGVGDTASETTSSRKDSAFSAEGKSISQLEEEIEKAQSKLELLKKSFADGSGTKAAIVQQESYIKSLQKTVLEREKDLKVINDVENRISALKKAQKETVYGSKEYNQLQSRINALDAKLPQTKSEKNEENKRKKEVEDAAYQILEIKRQNQQAEINLMEEGRQKKISQIRLDYQRQIDEIRKLEKKLSDANGGVLTNEQSIEISLRYSNAYLEMKKSMQSLFEDEKKSMNDYLAAYGDYYQKRNAIIAQGEKRKEGKNEWEQKSIDEETKRALSDLDIEANKQTSAISKLFDDMRERTVADMRAIADVAEEAFQFLQSGTWDESKGLKFGISKETFDTLRNSPEELERIRKGIEGIRNEADQSDTAFNKMAIGLKKVFNSDGNHTKLLEGLNNLQNGLNDTIRTSGFLSDTLSNLSDAFGSDVLSGIAEGINTAMDAASSAMSGAQAGAMFGPWGAAAGAAIGLVTSLASSIAKIHDKKNEKRIQRIQDQIDTLTDSYDKLGRSVEDAYSKDASNLIEQQNKLLEQQKVLIEQQIREEEDKKKTDDNRIKEWKQQIGDIEQTIADNKETMVDAIFGEDVQNAIENFVNAYAEAWANSEDKAESAKDTVKKMMQQMVTESIKAAIQSSGAIEDIRNKLQQFYADNVLTEWEQDYIYDMAEDLQKELDKRFGWADSLFGSDKAKEQQSASSGGYDTITQDQASELNGRFTALYEVGLQIYNTLLLMQSITVSVNEQNSVLFEIKNLIISSNGYLEDMSLLQKKMYELLVANVPSINNQLSKL